MVEKHTEKSHMRKVGGWNVVNPSTGPEEKDDGIQSHMKTLFLSGDLSFSSEVSSVVSCNPLDQVTHRPFTLGPEAFIFPAMRQRV